MPRLLYLYVRTTGDPVRTRDGILRVPDHFCSRTLVVGEVIKYNDRIIGFGVKSRTTHITRRTVTDESYTVTKLPVKRYRTMDVVE